MWLEIRGESFALGSGCQRETAGVGGTANLARVGRWVFVFTNWRIQITIETLIATRLDGILPLKLHGKMLHLRIQSAKGEAVLIIENAM